MNFSSFSLKKAGPISLAKDLICKNNSDELFFVFNSDIICDFPLEKLIAFHLSHGKEGTIIVQIFILCT